MAPEEKSEKNDRISSDTESPRGGPKKSPKRTSTKAHRKFLELSKTGFQNPPMGDVCITDRTLKKSTSFIKSSGKAASKDNSSADGNSGSRGSSTKQMPSYAAIVRNDMAKSDMEKDGNVTVTKQTSPSTSENSNYNKNNNGSDVASETKQDTEKVGNKAESKSSKSGNSVDDKLLKEARNSATLIKYTSKTTEEFKDPDEKSVSKSHGNESSKSKKSENKSPRGDGKKSTGKLKRQSSKLNINKEKTTVSKASKDSSKTNKTGKATNSTTVKIVDSSKAGKPAIAIISQNSTAISKPAQKRPAGKRGKQDSNSDTEGRTNATKGPIRAPASSNATITTKKPPANSVSSKLTHARSSSQYISNAMARIEYNMTSRVNLNERPSAVIGRGNQELERKLSARYRDRTPVRNITSASKTRSSSPYQGNGYTESARNPTTPRGVTSASNKNRTTAPMARVALAGNTPDPTVHKLQMTRYPSTEETAYDSAPSGRLSARRPSASVSRVNITGYVYDTTTGDESTDAEEMGQIPLGSLALDHRARTWDVSASQTVGGGSGTNTPRFEYSAFKSSFKTYRDVTGMAKRSLLSSMDVATTTRLAEASAGFGSSNIGGTVGEGISSGEDVNLQLFHNVVSTKFIYPYCPFMMKLSLADVPESATTASAGPYSSELLGSYNGGESGRLDEGQKGSVTDRQERRKGGGGHNTKDREGTLTELRPNSKKNGKQLSIIANGKSNNLEKEQRDRENNNKEKSLKDDCTNNSILPPASLHSTAKNGGGISLTSNGFRPMNSRNTFLGGQQITPTLPSQQRSSNTSSSHSRDSDDLVATGTNPLHPQGPGGPITQTPGNNGGRRGGNPSNGQANGLHSTQSSGALQNMDPRTAPTRKMPTKVLGPSARTREASEPKYADPLPGAPPTFQQRLSEINSLEQETIRYERTKKFKKKSKSET